MGDTPLADIPGNQFQVVAVNLPSRASNAGDAAIPLAVPRHAGSLVSADIVPHASQAGSATHFAVVDVINLSTDGTGTAVLASKSFSATGTSVAAAAPGPLSVAAAPTFTSADALAVSYSSQGNGIALVAHAVALTYRLT